MLVLGAADVRRALPMRAAIDGMKTAFAAFSDGRADVPLRTRLPVNRHSGLSLFMPAYVNSDPGEALAVKVVSLFPGNLGRGLAYIQAAVLVLEPDTGRTVGLLEGSSLTAIRTGAAGGAAIELLSRPESSVLAVFGAGVQARTQAEAACLARNVTTMWIFDPLAGQAESMAQELAGVAPIPADVRVAGSPAQALEHADIVCTATTSSSPVFPDSELPQGVHISAVGSYTPDMQEIPGETARRARVFVDSRAAALAEAGDLLRPISAGLFNQDHISAEIGEVFLGRKPGRKSPAEITLFKSVGLAVQDAIAAGIAMQNAHRFGIGHHVEF